MYSVAPMSTPRVGCAAIRTLGLRDSSRARITFWMLPPDRFLSGVSSDGVLIENLVDQLARVRGFMAPKSRKMPWVNRGLGVLVQEDVLLRR